MPLFFLKQPPLCYGLIILFKYIHIHSNIVPNNDKCSENGPRSKPILPNPKEALAARDAVRHVDDLADAVTRHGSNDTQLLRNKFQKFCTVSLALISYILQSFTLSTCLPIVHNGDRNLAFIGTVYETVSRKHLQGGANHQQCICIVHL